MADIAPEARKRLSDQKLLNLFQAHLFQLRIHSRRGTQSEVTRLDEDILAHQDGTLNDVIHLANVPVPRVFKQSLERIPVESARVFAIASRMNAKEVCC